MPIRLLPSLLAGAIALALQLSWCPPASAENPAARTVLAIHWGPEDFPGSSTLDAAIREVLLSPPGPPIDYYAEYLESDVLPPAAAAVALRDYIARKFDGRRIDAVIAITTPALDFALEHRQALFPGAPIAFVAGRVPDAVANHQIPGVTGVLSDVVFADTVELALKLHPSVRKVVVVAQAPNVDGYAARVRGALERFSQRVELTYVPQQSLPGLLATVRAIPSDSLIFFTRYVPDGVGSTMHSDEVLRRVAEVSPVPIYGTTDIYMGTGAVGGMMRVGRTTGLRLGAIARQVLDGVPPERIPIEALRLVPTFDWRQLQRWNIDMSSLPPGSDVRFVTPTIWDVYHRHIIIGSLAVVLVQAVLITGLLRQRARRRLAEQTIRAREATLRTSYERIQQMAGRLISAQEAARAGVAQDLHDDVCQQLVFVSMGVSTLKRSIRTAPGREDAGGPGDARGRHPEGVRGASTAVAGSASGDAATPRARGGPANALRRNGEAPRRGSRLQRRSHSRQRPQGGRGVLLPDRPGGAAERHRARRCAPPVRLPGGIGREP